MNNSTIKRFNALNLDAIGGIKDAELRNKALKLKKKQGGFTLLELLVVVTILAVIGGAMISSFGGQEAKAARGVATSTIAGIEDAMRIFTVTEGVLPNSLESLVCLDKTLAAHPTTITNAASPASWAAEETTKFGGVSNLPGIGGGMGAKLAGKFDLVSLPAAAGTALINAGITTLRYAEGTACDTDPATPVALIVGDNGADLPQASLAEMNIPAHAFEDPRPGTNRNRGRGFARDVSFGGATTPALMVWKNGGASGYNNAKVGAGATDVLIGLGLGGASTAVGLDNSPFAKAPFYGQVAKDKYPHYVLLVKVGTDSDNDGDLTDAEFEASETATIKAVVDPRGDFLDEEFAEFTGQKT